jgi:predicted trehalose synthase
VIAELAFGFWRHLADAAHEQTVWMPCLHHAWPRGTARARVDQLTRAVNTIRNRASHHEPLFAGGLVARVHADMLDLLDLLLPDLAAYVRATTTLPAVLASRP